MFEIPAELRSEYNRLSSNDREIVNRIRNPRSRFEVASTPIPRSVKGFCRKMNSLFNRGVKKGGLNSEELHAWTMRFEEFFR